MSMTIYHKRTTCRACGGDQLLPFLSLGPTPLANSFLHSKEEFVNEASYPMDVVFCQTCALVQLPDVIDPEVLFRDYIYLTGTSDTIAAHNREYAQTVVDHLNLDSDDLVIEVASNDGSLLKCFQEHAVRTLGIEPATNIAAIARENGVETINRFFNTATARNVKASYGNAMAVIGNNVLAHVDQPRDFLRGFKDLLSDRGLAIIEVPYLKELIDRLEYDTIYHEHHCYFSINSLLRLCDEVELSIVRIDHVPVHGGSLRMYAGRPDYYGGHHPSVLEMALEERQAGLNDFATYQEFAHGAALTRRELLDLLHSLKSAGKTVAGYGAPAKGNTLLNYCGIDTSLLPYTVDKSPLKVGTYTPGMHIPVLPVSTLVARQPDYVLILAWNFAREIMQQQSEYAQLGGSFIIPIPSPRIVTLEME
jgi:hypothetical protein